MKLPHRRRFLHLAAGAAALPAVTRFAWAQTYPTRPVHIVVGFAAGLGPDIIARLLAQSLSERLGQQVIVDNRPGAGSNIAAEVVVHAPADGYTLLVVTGTNTVNATLYDKLNFDLIRDIAPVASIGGGSFIMLVNPSFPAKTVPEFITYAKANPGKIDMASAGNGTAGHVFGELFKMMTGVAMQHVPYRGNFYSDLLGGQVQVTFGNMVSSIEYVRTGKLRALAVTTAARSVALPDIPAIAEFAPGYEASGWYGVGAPKRTPAEIIEKLNREINAALADPKFSTRLADLGNVPIPTTTTEFGKHIAEETEKWAKVIKFANMIAE